MRACDPLRTCCVAMLNCAWSGCHPAVPCLQRSSPCAQGGRMRRRELIAGLLLLPIDAPARAEALPRVSILHSGFPQRTPIHHLIEALQSLGYADGRTAKIEVLGGEADPK